MIHILVRFVETSYLTEDGWPDFVKDVAKGSWDNMKRVGSAALSGVKTGYQVAKNSMKATDPNTPKGPNLLGVGKKLDTTRASYRIQRAAQKSQNAKAAAKEAKVNKQNAIRSVYDDNFGDDLYNTNIKPNYQKPKGGQRNRTNASYRDRFGGMGNYRPNTGTTLGRKRVSSIPRPSVTSVTSSSKSAVTNNNNNKVAQPSNSNSQAQSPKPSTNTNVKPNAKPNAKPANRVLNNFKNMQSQSDINKRLKNRGNEEGFGESMCSNPSEYRKALAEIKKYLK